ncbi:transporter [uncultured Amphritea sp.]|jgi:hypothetical protein|uniref:transporter n=1 Tax=uncultured Amphritea sp. TaxID=981605 RepID=UPI0026116ED2|nr:transporter [uncultured Amphritea sp.]
MKKIKISDPDLKKSSIIISIILGSALSTSAFAIDVDAGDYTALPAGTNLAIAYYQNASRDELYAGGKKLAGDYSLDSDVGILRGVHFTEIGGYTVDPQFLLPFGSLDAGGYVAALGEESGVGDLILAATVWLVNKPAENTYFGITPFLYVPTGSYDNDSALNLGENRWKFTLQGGYITNLTEKVALDLVADVTLYGDNDDFGPGKGTLEQASSLQVQSYLRYQMNPSWDLRAGVSQSWGGETKVDGVNQNDEAEITKMTLGTAYFVDPTLQLLVNYGRDLDVKNGFKEENRLNFRILKAF